MVPSPRPLTYTWSSPDNANLNNFLSDFKEKAIVNLAENTPQLVPGLNTVEVVAVDFLGAKSAKRTLKITKLSKAAPGISFVGQPSYVASDEILLKGASAFSSCAGAAKGQLLFKSSSKQSALISGTFPQLWFPPRSLPAGTYVAKLEVSVSGDPSQQAHKTFVINAIASPLTAVLS